MTKRAFLLVVCLLTPPLAAEAARPVTFDDIMKMRRVESPAISPDGAFILYVVRQWEPSSRDPQRKEARPQVWRVATADGSTRQLTFDDAGATAPAWSPDGRYISFLSARGSSADDRRAQVWVMRDGRRRSVEAHRLEGIDLVVRVGAGWQADRVRQPRARDSRRRGAAQARRRSARLRGRVPPGAHLGRLGRRQDDRSHHRGAAFTVRGAPSWSADSLRIAFAAAPTTMVRDDRSDIYIAEIASKTTRKITSNPGPDSEPRWSPDGRSIAFVSDPNSSAPIADGTLTMAVVNARLMLYDVAAGSMKSAEGFDGSVGDPEWTPDGRAPCSRPGKASTARSSRTSSRAGVSRR